jgi:hypothetical protein
MAGGSALATTTVSSALTSIRFELIDLDLNDGIAPALTFAKGMPWSVYAVATDTRIAVTDRRQLDGFSYAAESGAVDAVRNFASTHGSLSGDPFVGTGAAVSSGAAERTGYGLAYASFRGDFTLTPRTRLTVTAQVTMNGATTGDGFEEAGSQYFLNLIGAGSSNTLSQYLNAIPLPGEPPAMPHSYFLDRQLTATISNVTAVGATGTFDIGTSVSVMNNMIMVPEPQSGALMLIGMVGVMTWARRGRRAEPPSQERTVHS